MDVCSGAGCLLASVSIIEHPYEPIDVNVLPGFFATHVVKNALTWLHCP